MVIDGLRREIDHQARRVETLERATQKQAGRARVQASRLSQVERVQLWIIYALGALGVSSAEKIADAILAKIGAR